MFSIYVASKDGTQTVDTAQSKKEASSKVAELNRKLKNKDMDGLPACELGNITHFGFDNY